MRLYATERVAGHGRGTHGVNAPARRALRELTRERGVRGASDLLGVSRATILVALAETGMDESPAFMLVARMNERLGPEREAA